MKAIASLLILAAVAVMHTSARADVPEGWTDNYAKAVEQAKTEHKKVLLDFTGSDWCGWCKKFDAEVFDTPKFKEYATKHLVLVKVDFPRSVAQTDEVKDQNKKLQAKYGANGFPTLILVNTQGKKLVEQQGYLEGGPDAFIKVLKGAH